VDNLERFIENCRYGEYTKAVDPIHAGKIPKIPFKEFDKSLFENGESRIIPLDASLELECEGPATSPVLCANYIRILSGDKISAHFNATSQVAYIIRGKGITRWKDDFIPWEANDFVVLPAGQEAVYEAHAESIIFLVHDEPLLRYLGAKANLPRFKPTLYTSKNTLQALDEVRKEAETVNRNRISVVLINEKTDQTQSITHTSWAMLGVLPKGAIQLPHRHQSVAIDLILDCEPGCFTLVGDKISPEGKIINPKRIDWKPYGVFITPPGLWHAHFNESSSDANLIPMQDAGLHSYLRTLDIKFSLPNGNIFP
jgi:gentisate 1,2-dioxygenase